MQSEINLLRGVDSPKSEESTGYNMPDGEVDIGHLRAIRKAETDYGLPKNLLSRLIKIESNFNPNAIGPRTKTGERAVGIAQIMPSMHPGVDPKDAMASIEYAAKLLRGHYDKLGDWNKAIAAYNWGPKNVEKQGMEKAPEDVKDYVNNITGGNGGPPPEVNMLRQKENLPTSEIDLLRTPTVNPEAEYYKQNLQNYLSEQDKQPMKAAEGFETSTTGPITGVPLQYTPRPGESLVPEPVRELVGGAGEVAEGLPAAVAGGIAGGMVGGPVGAFAGAGLAVSYKEAYDAWKKGDLTRLGDIVTGGVFSNTPEKIYEAARNLGIAPDEIQNTKDIPTRMRDAASNIAQAVPFFGPMTQRVQELMKEGKYWRAGGYAGAMVAVPAVAETIGGDRIGKASAKTADEVKPIVEEAKQKQAVLDSVSDSPVKEQAIKKLQEETKAKVDEVVTSNATDVIIKTDLDNKAKEVKKAKVKKARTPEQIEADKAKMAALRAKRQVTKQVEPPKPGTIAQPTPEKPLPGIEIVMTDKEQAKAKGLMEEGRDNGQIAFEMDVPEKEIAKLRQQSGIVQPQIPNPEAALSAQKTSIIYRAEGLGLDAERLSRKMFQKEFKDLSAEELDRLDKGFSREPVRSKIEQPVAQPEPEAPKPVSITAADMNALDAKFGEDAWIEWSDEKVAEEIGKIREGKPAEKPAEITEPLTEVDLQTGVEEPRALADADHPLSTDAEGTLEQQSAYSKSKSIAGSVQELLDQLLPGRTGVAKDPGVTLWKWMNDVNRFRHGDQAIDIAKTRDNLSELAVKVDEFKSLFENEAEHEGWKELTSDAAEWARRADNSKIKRTEGTQLYSGIPLDALAEEIKKLYGAIRKPEDIQKAIDIVDDRITRTALKMGKEFNKDKPDPDYINRLQLSMDADKAQIERWKAEQEIGRRGTETEGSKLYSGIDPYEVAKKLKDIWRSISRVTVEGEVSGKDIKNVLKENAGWEWNVVDLNTLFEDNKRYTDKEVVGALEAMSGIPKTKLIKFYSGAPVDELIRLAKSASAYVDRARGMKDFAPAEAWKSISKDLKLALLEKSATIQKEMLDKLGDVGYDILQKMRLSKGASARAYEMLRQMRKEVYNGLSSREKNIMDKLVLNTRIIDIGSYKKPKQFIFPKDEVGNEMNPQTASAYTLMFQQLEGLSPEKAYELYHVNPDGTAGGRVGAYYEWMRKPLQDMLEEGLITDKEFSDLVSHNYRRIGTVDSPLTLADIIDKKYEVKIGNVKRTIYDSGVERLARGKSSDIYEPSSEIMALEVFNRAYGRIMNNQANRALLDLARSQPDNPFVRTKIKDGAKIPSGWSPNFVYEKGVRKTIYLSPDMAKEWITNTRDISARASRIIKYSTGAPLTRTMATGVEWSFALANLARDMQQLWFAARTLENGQWKPVYSPHAPVFAFQLGVDMARVASDAWLRKGTYQEMAKEGGLMDFLAHQARPFQRGLHLEGPTEHVYNALAKFGEASELVTRLAIRERAIRNKANQLGIKMEEARANPKITREATFAARDYMDFAQGGWFTKVVDQGVPYLNASIVGMRSFFRSFKPGSGSAAASTYKLAQYATAIGGLYLASKFMTPKTHEELRNDINTQNNLIIPLGDSFAFKDAHGNTRYPYMKIPIEQNLRWFKKFFEATIDKWQGDPIDIDGTVNALQQLSPAGISSLPPLENAIYGYWNNKDSWRDEAIWRKTDKPFKWPNSAAETIPGQTPQLATDVGDVTKMSPERLRYMTRTLIGNSMWGNLVGGAYEKVMSDIPPKQRQQQLAEVLAGLPVVNRFFGVTNPQSRYGQKMEKLNEESVVKNYIENSRLDLRINGYLYDKNYSRKDVIDYIHSFKDEDTRDRMRADLVFQEAMAKSKIENKSFWADLKRLPADAKARAYVEELAQSSPERRAQLKRERAIVDDLGTILGEKFWEELPKAKKALRVR